MAGKQTARAHTHERKCLGPDRKDLFLYRRASLHFWSKSFAILSIFCFSSVLMDITLASCCCRWLSMSSFKCTHHQTKYCIYYIIFTKRQTGLLLLSFQDISFVKYTCTFCQVYLFCRIYTFYSCNLYLYCMWHYAAHKQRKEREPNLERAG